MEQPALQDANAEFVADMRREIRPILDFDQRVRIRFASAFIGKRLREHLHTAQHDRYPATAFSAYPVMNSTYKSGPHLARAVGDLASVDPAGQADIGDQEVDVRCRRSVLQRHSASPHKLEALDQAIPARAERRTASGIGDCSSG